MIGLVAFSGLLTAGEMIRSGGRPGSSFFTGGFVGSAFTGAAGVAEGAGALGSSALAFSAGGATLLGDRYNPGLRHVDNSIGLHQAAFCRPCACRQIQRFRGRDRWLLS